jgi:glucose/mannose-6-phosphate isomerase
MLEASAALPAQVRDAWGRTRSLTLTEAHRGAKAVAVLGMGGSAIGGDLVRGIWSDRLRVPLEVVRGYDLPAWVDQDTLVVASSYSGATEETMSAFGQAIERRSPVAILTTGGTFLDVARRANLPHVSFPGGGQPRAAVGYSVTLLAGLLERAGMLSIDDAEIGRAVATADAAVAAAAPELPTSANAAKQLAWALLDRIPVIEAGGFLGPVARRWKTQLNENGKTLAIWEELPEATHNAVVGYPQPDDIRDHQHVVFLESEGDHPRNATRARLSRELLSANGIGHQVVSVVGPDRFARALDAIVMGDFVSVYLAALYGIDPTPVDAISELKEALARSDRPTPDDDDGLSDEDLDTGP